MDRFVLYLDMEHPRALLSRAKRARHLRSVRRDCRKFRELSGAACLCQSFIWFDSHIEDLPLLAMIISGNRTDWSCYASSQLEEPLRAIRACRIPILGICGGLQLICKAFGGAVGPIRKLGEGETDPHPSYMPGYYKERGYTRVRILRKSPLFLAMRGEITVHESHYCEVKRLPRALNLLASSENCRVQAVGHREKALYGVQFHPECFDDGHPDGRTILQNFFNMASSRSG